MSKSEDNDRSDRLYPVEFTTLYELYPARSPIYASLYWYAAGAFLTIASVISFAVTGNRLFIFTFLPLALGGMLVVRTTRKVYDLFLDWEDQMLSFIDDKKSSDAKLREWFAGHFRNGTRFWPPFIVAIVFIIISFVVWGSTGVYSGLDTGSLILAILILLFTSFVVGVVLCLLYFLARLIIELGTYKVVVTPHSFGVLSLGHLLVSAYSWASVCWFVIALSGVAIFREAPWPLALLGLPTIVFVLGSFVSIQFPVHKQMKRYKKEELQKIDALVRKLIPYEIDEISTERLEQIKFYQDHAKAVSSLPEWPYHWRGAVKVTLSSLVAASPSLATLAANAGLGGHVATYFIAN